MKRFILLIVVIMTVVLPTQAALLSQVEAMYDFEGSDAGTRWDDKSGNGLDITARNRINVIDGSGTLFDGYSGQSAGYQHPTNPPGQNSAWLKVETGGNFNRASQLDPIAIEFWFKPVSGTVIGDLVRYGGGYGTGTLAVSFQYVGGRYIHLFVYGDEDGGGELDLHGQSETFEVANGEWSHVRFIYDGTTVKAWHGETEILNQPWTHGIRNPQLSPTTPFDMFNSQGIVSYYNGGLDQVEVSTGTVPLVLLDGDANRDGVVSAGDYASVQSNFGNTGTAGLDGDANGDGVVSAGDYASVQANFGNVSPTAAIPEPASMSLLGVGVVMLIRRKRKSE